MKSNVSVGVHHGQESGSGQEFHGSSNCRRSGRYSQAYRDACPRTSQVGFPPDSLATVCHQGTWGTCWRGSTRQVRGRRRPSLNCCGGVGEKVLLSPGTGEASGPTKPFQGSYGHLPAVRGHRGCVPPSQGQGGADPGVRVWPRHSLPTD